VNRLATPIVCSNCSKPIERATQRVYPIVKRIGIWPISSGVPQHRKCS
jgi:hypothetical protein